MAEKYIIRTANITDMKDVFELSNDNTVRQNSIHQEKIQWENHVIWYKNKINSKNTLFYIVRDEDNFIGYCRLDKDDNKWVITIHIDHKYRNNGYGSKILNTICSKNIDKELIAYVKKDNIASYKMFLKCGFSSNNIVNIDNIDYYMLKHIQYNVIAISNNLYNETELFNKKNTIYITKKSDLTYDNLKKINPKYVFFPHWSYIIPPEIYKNFECIIFHMTDLPFGRGGSPLQNLIERGIYQTKISAIKCEQELDSGAIYLKKDFDISYGSASEIYKRAGKIITKMINEIIELAPTPIAQDGQIVTFKRRSKEDSNIDKIKDLNKIYDYIRMLDADGYPKAFLLKNNIKFSFCNANYTNGKIIAQVEIEEEDEQ